MEPSKTIETFKIRFESNSYTSPPTFGTMTIPVLFEEFIEIKETRCEYDDHDYNYVHIDTERYLSQLIDKVITGELSPRST
jgi:hypothetical protein